MLYQPPPRRAYSPPHISIDVTNLNAVEHFTYQGSVISTDATVSKDLDKRLPKANSSFGKLSKRVWQSHSLRLSMIQAYRSVGIPMLLCGAETWVLYRKLWKASLRHTACISAPDRAEPVELNPPNGQHRSSDQSQDSCKTRGPRTFCTLDSH